MHPGFDQTMYFVLKLLSGNKILTSTQDRTFYLNLDIFIVILFLVFGELNFKFNCLSDQFDLLLHNPVNSYDHVGMLSAIVLDFNPTLR